MENVHKKITPVYDYEEIERSIIRLEQVVKSTHSQSIMDKTPQPKVRKARKKVKRKLLTCLSH
jgi:hypothetical protein